MQVMPVPEAKVDGEDDEEALVKRRVLVLLPLYCYGIPRTVLRVRYARYAVPPHAFAMRATASPVLSCVFAMP